MTWSPWAWALCAWSSRRLALRREAGVGALGSSVLARHLARCSDCRQLQHTLDRVERGLTPAASTSSFAPSAALRARVIAAFHRFEPESSPPPVAPLAWTPLMRRMVGALAVLSLLGLTWALLPGLMPPPREVRIALPSGYQLGEVSIVIERLGKRGEIEELR